MSRIEFGSDLTLNQNWEDREGRCDMNNAGMLQCGKERSRCTCQSQEVAEEPARETSRRYAAAGLYVCKRKCTLTILMLSMSLLFLSVSSGSSLGGPCLPFDSRFSQSRGFRVPPVLRASPVTIGEETLEEIKKDAVAIAKRPSHGH